MPTPLAIAVVLLAACATSGDPAPPADADADVYRYAHGCYLVQASGEVLGRTGDGFAFQGEATPFRLQPTDLGTYALFDPDEGYVVDADGVLARQTTLRSDVTEVDDAYLSGAEWVLEATDTGELTAHSRKGAWLTLDGLGTATDAAALALRPAEGCATYPEMSLDATGAPGQTVWPDGDVYGFVDMHSHLFSNFGFGGGLFHGSVFHPLGVTHAMGDCDVVHGESGRKDFFGYAYDAGGNDGSLGALIPDMIVGELSVDNHATDGWPTFSDWPHSADRSTHQTQYYKWLERSWLGGLRLIVQHATSNAVICNISRGEGWAPSRYDCEDMTAVDRQIDATYALERYLDAQSGGPGEGWLRVVTTPAQAREVIRDGKLAVILGIETSDLFDCHLTPRPDGPVCDEAHVDAQLDAYYARGVRALFPNHKYDNAFTPGDGSNGFIEAGNFLNSGYYTNKVEEGCPTDVPAGFDHGPVTFGGLLEPRDVYQSTPPEDLSELPEAPIATIFPFVLDLAEGEIEGDFCQNGTLTPIGEHLIEGIMARGMLLEVDHLPRWSYRRAYEMLREADYPALGTHGRDNYGALYELGGLTMGDFGRCHDPDEPGTSLAGYRERLQAIIDAGLHPSLGFGFDFNGFAGGPRPRFDPDRCDIDQVDPVTYPFTSVDGAVTFTQPMAGQRVFDFNTEGMAHIGLIPEYIEDARHDGATEADLEALFRSAEGYLRLWERAEARGASLAGD